MREVPSRDVSVALQVVFWLAVGLLVYAQAGYALLLVALAAGRNALTWDAKFAADVAYVDQWSLWLDARVLALSVWRVLRREGVSAEGHATMPRFEGHRE